MGRSSRAQADENRRKIVEAASALFRARGIEAVGIADVMNAAGMTQGGFYRHFASKEALAAEACAFAFSKAAENWKKIARDASRHGRSAAAAIEIHYLAPKPPAMTCPMISIAPSATHGGTSGPLREAYETGVETLFRTFAEQVLASDPSTPEDRVRQQFEGMVGANMLALATGGGAWANRYKRASGTMSRTDG